MALISATSTATPSLQSVLSKSRLTQARQQANQAEANAEDLRTRVDQAEQEASQSQARVQALSRQQNDPTYRPKSSRSEGGFSAQTQEVLVTSYAATASSRAVSNSLLRTDALASPVTNSQGNLTGRIVDLQA